MPRKILNVTNTHLKYVIIREFCPRAQILMLRQCI